jgi:uncharacterized membrane protein
LNFLNKIFIIKNGKKLRTIIRTLSYRFVALLITALWTGLGDAILIHIILTVVHYCFERIWLKVKWGVINTQNINY